MSSESASDGGDWQRIGALATLRVARGTLTLLGQCVSGVRSALVVPELGVGFDAGFSFDALIESTLVCVTHGHADHIGALHMHAFERHVQHARAALPTYLMPAACVADFNAAHDALARLNIHPARRSHDDAAGDLASDNHRRYCVVGLQSGDAQPLPKGGGALTVRAYDTQHGVPSLAFCVFRRAKRRRAEFLDVPGAQLAQLRKQGVAFEEVTNVPILAYTGDSTIDGIVQHDDLVRADVLVMECTYIFGNRDAAKDSPDEAKRRGHVHEQHIIERAARFKCNELVLCHFSKRYRRAEIDAAVARIQQHVSARVRAFVS